MEKLREKLLAFADALDQASALAREIADREATPATITVDGESAGRALYRAIHDNPAAERE